MCQGYAAACECSSTTVRGDRKCLRAAPAATAGHDHRVSAKRGCRFGECDLARRISISPAIKAVLEPVLQDAIAVGVHELENARGLHGERCRPYLPTALKRAGHTPISRHDRREEIDDFTVMAISGHQRVRMVERYTHPTSARKLEALTVDLDGQNLGRTENDDAKKIGGRREARTRDLRIANAALSQLS